MQLCEFKLLVFLPQWQMQIFSFVEVESIISTYIIHNIVDITISSSYYLQYNLKIDIFGILQHIALSLFKYYGSVISELL